MKKLLWGVVIIVALVVIALGVGLWRIDSIVRSVVQSQSAAQLQVPVTLDGAKVSLLNGTLALHKYNIGSPAGFTAPQLFSVDNMSVAVSYSQLRQDPIHITSIEIDKPQLVLEHGGGGKFNIQALMETLSKNASQTESTEPVRLIIDSLVINGATVSLRPGDLSNVPLVSQADLKKLDIKQQYTLTLPSIRLTNIGSGDGAENGAAIQEVVMQVVSAMADQVAKSPELPEPLRLMLSGNLDAVGDMVKNKLQDKLGKIGDDLNKKLSDGAEKALGQALDKKGSSKQDSPSDKKVDKAIGNELGDLLGERKTKKQDQPQTAPQQQPQGQK